MIGEQPLDAIAMARAFVLEFEQFAMQLPVFLVSRAGDPHDAPHLGLAAVIAEQHGQQLGNVEAIALGAALWRLTPMEDDPR